MMMSGIISGMAASLAAVVNWPNVARLRMNADGPEEMAVDHQPDADEHAGHHAAKEQPADRDVAGRAIHHGHDAGRDQVRHGGGGGDQRGGEGEVVAFALHFRRQRARQDGDVGGRRA